MSHHAVRYNKEIVDALPGFFLAQVDLPDRNLLGWTGVTLDIGNVATRRHRYRIEENGRPGPRGETTGSTYPRSPPKITSRRD